MHNRFWLKVGKIKDKKLWLFDLCRDARWSNGELVTTYNVVYSWRRLANPTIVPGDQCAHSQSGNAQCQSYFVRQSFA